MLAHVQTTDATNLGGVGVELLDFIGFEVMGVEFTSVCNLKCSYCDVAADGYVGKNTPQKVLDRAHEIVRRAKPRWMNFTGIGELTTIQNWPLVVERFRLDGMVCAITTNLQKQMSDQEIAELTRFQHIAISIDTADAQFLREIRVKAELRNITTNLMRMRAHAIKRRAKPPFMQFNVVLTHRNALKLHDLCAFAVACQVDKVFLIDLNDENFYNIANTVKHVRTLSEADRQEMFRQISASSELLAAHGKKLGISGELQRQVGAERSATTEVPAGKTRICDQLWNYGVIKDDGRISHCCANLMSEKSVLDHEVDEIMNDGKIRDWRRGLLTGERLAPACVNCHWAPVGEPVDFQRLIARLKIRRMTPP